MKPRELLLRVPLIRPGLRVWPRSCARCWLAWARGRRRPGAAACGHLGRAAGAAPLLCARGAAGRREGAVLCLPPRALRPFRARCAPSGPAPRVALCHGWNAGPWGGGGGGFPENQSHLSARCSRVCPLSRRSTFSWRNTQGPPCVGSLLFGEAARTRLSASRAGNAPLVPLVSEGRCFHAMHFNAPVCAALPCRALARSCSSPTTKAEEMGGKNVCRNTKIALVRFEVTFYLPSY